MNQQQKIQNEKLKNRITEEKKNKISEKNTQRKKEKIQKKTAQNIEKNKPTNPNQWQNIRRENDRL